MDTTELLDSGALTDEAGESAVSDAADTDAKPRKGFDVTAALRRAFGRTSAERSDPADEERDTADEAAPRAEKKAPKAGARAEEKPADTQPAIAFQTREEYERAIQAETDRREAQRRARETREQKKALRERDPIRFARLDAEEEQQAEAAAVRQAEFVQVLGAASQEFDRKYVDPVVLRLPQDVRDELVKKAPAGIEGRVFLINEGLKHLEKSAYDKAKADLRKNPALRKELLAELRGASDEPELVPSRAASRAGEDTSPNVAIRAAMAAALGRHH